MSPFSVHPYQQKNPYSSTKFSFQIYGDPPTICPKNVLFMARYWNGKKVDPLYPARHSKWNEKNIKSFLCLPTTSISPETKVVWKVGASTLTSQVYLPDMLVSTWDIITWLAFDFAFCHDELTIKRRRQIKRGYDKIYWLDFDTHHNRKYIEIKILKSFITLCSQSCKKDIKTINNVNFDGKLLFYLLLENSFGKVSKFLKYIQ